MQALFFLENSWIWKFEVLFYVKTWADNTWARSLNSSTSQAQQTLE